MILTKLEEKKLIHPPSWLVANTHYSTMMGSVAYGVSMDTSDVDVYGFCIPKKEMVFPHLSGEILGFGNQIKRFEQWQEHHVFHQDDLSGRGRTYDFSIYNIVKYFQLLMDNNPNIIDSIFTPEDCVLHCTQIGRLLRDNRKGFLHKGSWHKFRGYAWSMFHKITSKENFIKADKLRQFEEKNNISHDISFKEVEEEIKKRNIEI